MVSFRQVSQPEPCAHLSIVTYFNTFPQSSFAAILESTVSFTFVEPCKQYRSTVEFNFIDSTALLNLGDPCKRTLSKEAGPEIAVWFQS